MNRRKRLTALLLALAMCLSILPANVLAVELGSEGEATEVVEPKDSGEPVEGEPIEVEEAQMTEEEETVQEPEKDESAEYHGGNIRQVWEEFDLEAG